MTVEFNVVMKNGKFFEFKLFMEIIRQLEILLENQHKPFIFTQEVISVINKVLSTKSGEFFQVAEKQPRIGIAVSADTVKSLHQMGWLGTTGVFSIRVAEIIKSVIQIGENGFEVRAFEDIIENYDECLQQLEK